MEQLSPHRVQFQAMWTVCAQQPKTTGRAGTPDGGWGGGGQLACSEGSQAVFVGSTVTLLLSVLLWPQRTSLEANVL